MPPEAIDRRALAARDCLPKVQVTPKIPERYLLHLEDHGVVFAQLARLATRQFLERLGIDLSRPHPRETTLPAPQKRPSEGRSGSTQPGTTPEAPIDLEARP